ncbi:MAG: clostripain-related cysteine peptidase, partial [candidate division WOR-3 bacterium]
MLLFALFSLFFSSAVAIDWTVMIYMCADNSMNDQSYIDLQEMMQVGSTDNVKIIVQIDNAAFGTETGCRRYLIKNNQKELLVDLGEVDMANPQTLIDFARFTNSYYRANRYLLILWDHGNGWPIGEYCANSEKGVIYDQSSNNWIGVADGELRYAVNEIKKILSKKISILAFDACLMAMTEVASEIADGAEFMFASEEVIPNNGLPYADILSLIVSQPTIATTQIAKQLVDISVNSYNYGSQGYHPCTFSAIDLKQYSKAAKKFSTTCQMLTAYANTNSVKQARSSVQTFSIESYQIPPSNYDDYIDLIDLLEKINQGITNPADYENIQRIIKEFNKAVINNRFIGSYLANAKGISVWFPDNYLAFKRSLAEYQNLTWANTTFWLTFLNNYYAADDIKPSPVNILNPTHGQKNDFRLYWSKSNDLSPVQYTLLQINDLKLIFQDNCDSTSFWIAEGFITSTQYYYSSSKSFFSSIGNNLNNKLALKDSFSMPDGGLLSFMTYYETEERFINGHYKRDVFYVEMLDTNGHYQILDSCYGISRQWTEHRYLLPRTEKLKIRFRYQTDATNTSFGVYIDDIKIYTFTNP